MENPVGLNGIEFVEYASPTAGQLETLFKSFGFENQGRHKTKAVEVFRQGDIKFLINHEKGSFAESFQKKHGPSICSMGWRVSDSKKALDYAVEKGAKPVCNDGLKDHPYPAVLESETQ